MNKKITTKNSKNQKKVVDENVKSSHDDPPILSYQKFVLEIKRGLDSPYLTTGFVVTYNRDPDEYIVVDPTPYSPFMSQDKMHKIADELFSHIIGLPPRENEIVVKVPRVFSLNYASSGILKTKLCGFLFGHLLGRKLVEHKRSPFSVDTNDLTTLALNTKVHFGNGDGVILLHSEGTFPLVGRYHLEDLSPLNDGELVVSDDNSESLKKNYKTVNPLEFSFVDETPNDDVDTLAFIVHTVDESNRMSSIIDAIPSLIAQAKMDANPSTKGDKK